eukprot:7943936-Karenia_brevis.AAC.1
MDLQCSHSLAPRQTLGGINTAKELGVSSSPKNPSQASWAFHSTSARAIPSAAQKHHRAASSTWYSH